MNNGMRIMRGELEVPSTTELVAGVETVELPPQLEPLEGMTWQQGLGRIARQAGNALAISMISVGRMSSGDCTVHPQLGQALYPKKENEVS